MTQDTLARQLNESRRDALLTYYEGYVAPGLMGEPIASDEDVYQYLLVDTDVSEDVNTSQVAQAISSLQQYLYRIALNQEPGLKPMEPADLEEWRDTDSQYAIWSAGQQISDYPENYISPLTRQNKSRFFTELENKLNQNQLDPDRVQDAVLTYLNEFEDVSDLEVINGYCDQLEVDKAKYFFIGRTAEQPYRYYWRMMDLSKNGSSEKHPIITPNCWNDWQPVDLPLSADSVLSHTIRPVYFNNRLYVTWAERNPTPKKKDDGTNSNIHRYTVHYAYLRFDNTWAAPAIGDLQGAKDGTTFEYLADKALEIDEGPDSSDFAKTVDTVAHVDINRSSMDMSRTEGNLFIGLFRFDDNQSGIDKFAPRAFVYCDTSMVDLTPENDVVEENFEVYWPAGTDQNDINYQPIQQCFLGKQFEIVGPLKDMGSIGGYETMPVPTVTVLDNGITLHVHTTLGDCQFTSDHMWRLGSYMLQPRISIAADQPYNKVVAEKDFPEAPVFGPGYPMDFYYQLDRSLNRGPDGHYSYILTSGIWVVDGLGQNWAHQWGVTLRLKDRIPGAAPVICTRYDVIKGNVQFLSFDGPDGPGGTIDKNTHDYHPQIAALNDGGWVVTWAENNNPNAFSSRIYQQHYDRAGWRLPCQKLVVNSEIPRKWAQAPCAGLNNGGWIVVWSDTVDSGVSGYRSVNLFLQRFDNKGNPLGDEVQVSTDTAVHSDLYPSISALAEGGWVVVWQSYTSDKAQVKQRFFNASGEAGPVTAVSHQDAVSSDSSHSSVAGLMDGGWVVTWVDDSEANVKMRRYYSNGDARGEEQVVITSGDIYPLDTPPLGCCVCALKNGGWVVGGDWVVVKTKTFDAEGNGLFGAFGADKLTDVPASPTMAGLGGDDGWIGAWQRKRGDTNDVDIAQQRHANHGYFGGEILANSFSAQHGEPVIASLSGDGGWVIAWQTTDDSSGTSIIFQRQYNSAGQATGEERQVTSTSTLLPTRLNTTFVPLLINLAGVNLDRLLSYYTQATPVEPPLIIEPDSLSGLQTMDYNGANGLYFWELFFHIPFMIASRLAAEGQNELAQDWLHYILDPGARDRPEDADTSITPPDYWNNYAISTGADQSATSSHMTNALLDPDALAYANPVIYRKAVYLAYVRTVMALGDSQYRMVTPDSLTAARVYYDIALELLGPSPDVMVSERWQPMALDTLAAQTNSALRAFEEEAGLTLLDMPSSNSTFLAMLDNPQFRPPLNSDLLGYWATLDSRLYNLRNNLSIDGKPLNLPLYATPADPMSLLTQRAAAGSQGGGNLPAAQIVLPYGFKFMLPVASTAVAMLTQYGDLLLSFLERGDSAQQVELGQQQMVDLSGFAISLQQQELKALEADAEALTAQKAISDQRFEFYWSSYNQNISSAEQQSMDLQTEALQTGLVEQGFNIAGGALDMLPNIFGLADGGMVLGAAMKAVGEGVGLERLKLELQAKRLEQAENYRNRRNDWQEQYIQAQLESEMIGKQLDALAIRQQAVRTAIEQATMQQKQQQAMLRYLTSRFTGVSLYQWLGGQLSALYYQAYDSVLSLCLNVQSCWQYEIGDFTTTFMRTNAWNNSWRGLLAGQALALDLQRMERAYYTRNDRPLNIFRTVSLKALLKAANKDFETVKKTGSFDFSLLETLFDNDYPGHYARRLQQVSITLPTLLGPYQNVRAILSQSSSSILFKPDIDGVKALMDGTTPPADSGVVTNLRPSQQVALSGGLDDNGVFELTMQDGRYLPFEGTGAVSSWRLQFPRAVEEKDGGYTLGADPEQAAMLEALDDVLVHIQYTALDAGAQFASAVRQELAQQQKVTSTGATDQGLTRKSRVRQPALKRGKGTLRKA